MSITIDFHAYAGQAVVTKFDNFCALKLSEGGDTINLFFEPQDFDKAEQIATLLNEAFDSRSAYAESGFIRPAKIEPSTSIAEAAE